jgi:hypothetical protein
VNALVFLGIAAVLSVLGCGILWLRSRQPGSMEAHIEEFAKELDALAPGSAADKARRPAPRTGRNGLDRLPDRGAGPERPERPRLPPQQGPQAGSQAQRRLRPPLPGGPGSRRPGPGPGPDQPSPPGSRPRSG